MSRATMRSSTAGASLGSGARNRMGGATVPRTVRDAAIGRADPHEERYDAGMVRHRRIVLATTAALAGLLSAAFAPAAGDQRVSDASSHAVTYNEDGVPMV